MPIIAKSEVKSDWLDIASADTSKDALIDRLIDAVDDEIIGICAQPIAQTTVITEFMGEASNVYPLFYTVPVTLTTLKGRNTPSEAWETITADKAAFANNGVYSLYCEDGFAEYAFYQATMSVGYTTVPDDVKLCAYEMVTELYLNTPFAPQVNRFGVSAVSESQGGVTVSKTLLSMRERARKRLAPYTRVLI